MEKFHPLESWLGRSDNSSLRPPPQPLDLRKASLAWAAVRQLAQLSLSSHTAPLMPGILLHLDYLRLHRFLLHISDTDARALSTLVGKMPAAAAESSIPSEWDAICQSVLLLFAVWVRRLSPAPPGLAGRGRSNTEAENVLSSLVTKLTEVLTLLPPQSVGAAILLLGAACACHACPEPSRVLARKCLSDRRLQGSSGLRMSVFLPEVLAGFGYAMSATQGADLELLFSALLSLWTISTQSEVAAPPRSNRTTSMQDKEKSKLGAASSFLRDIQLLLRLMEFEGARLENEGRQGWSPSALEDLKYISRLCVLVRGEAREAAPSTCACLVAAGGLLRGLAGGRSWQHRRGLGDGEWLAIQERLGGFIVQSAADACPWVLPASKGGSVGLKSGFQVIVPPGMMTWMPPPPLAWAPMLDFQREYDPESESAFAHARSARHWLRTACVVVSDLCSPGGGGLDFHPSLLWCLAAGLLGDALQPRGWGQVMPTEAGEFSSEAPGLTRALCDLLQQAEAEEGGHVSMLVDTVVWFCTSFQCSQRQVAVLSHPTATTIAGHSAFLSVYLLLQATLPSLPQKTNTPKSQRNPGSVKGGVSVMLTHAVWPHAVSALHSFSLLDSWRVEAPGYGQLVARAVGQVSRDERAVAELVRRMPLYGEVVSGAEPHPVSWPSDPVQVASIFYWIRVLQPCLPRMPPTLFAERVAPFLFLSLHHPNSELALSAHSLFSSFLRSNHPESSGDLLKEKLSLYYTERCLQGYPHLVSFQSLVPGVGAIAQHLPPGSPAVALCLTAIADRCRALSTAARQVAVCDVAGKGEGLEAGKGKVGGEGVGVKGRGRLEEGSRQLQSLLSFLIPVVDIQTLPLLLQQVAALLLSLTAQGLPPHPPVTELFQILSASDDYTRKPLTVPFFQTLAYLAPLAAQGQRGEEGEGGSSRVPAGDRQGGLSGRVPTVSDPRGGGYGRRRGGGEGRQGGGEPMGRPARARLARL